MKVYSTVDGLNSIVDRYDVERELLVLRGIEASDGIRLNVVDCDGIGGTPQKKIVLGMTSNQEFNNMNVSGDVHIRGNLVVDGAYTRVNTADMDIQDTIITLNKGERGSGISTGSAGIRIDRGSNDPVSLTFSEAMQSWDLNGVALANIAAPISSSQVGSRGYNDGRYLLGSNNLADLTNPSTARVSLGLGDIALQSSSSVSIKGGGISGVTISGSTASLSSVTTDSLTVGGIAYPATVGTSGSYLASNGVGFEWSLVPVYSIENLSGLSLVSNGVGPNFQIKGLIAGQDIGLSSNGSSVTISVTGVMHDLVEDMSPSLGGALDVNGYAISNSLENGNIVLSPSGTGIVILGNHRLPYEAGVSGKLLMGDGTGSLRWETFDSGLLSSTSINYENVGTVSSHLAGIDVALGESTSRITALETSIAETTIIVDEVAIQAGQYSEYAVRDVFGSSYDARRSIISVQVKDTVAESPTYNMFINADAVCTVATTQSIVRVINEYDSSLVFHITIKKV